MSRPLFPSVQDCEHKPRGHDGEVGHDCPDHAVVVCGSFSCSFGARHYETNEIAQAAAHDHSQQRGHGTGMWWRNEEAS